MDGPLMSCGFAREGERAARKWPSQIFRPLPGVTFGLVRVLKSRKLCLTLHCSALALAVFGWYGRCGAFYRPRV
jgi:hypothetical protein